MGSVDRNQKTLPPGAAPTKPAAVAAAEPIPAALANNPDYEVLRELNRGGMGVVYLARNRRMDRLECLKVVNEGLLKQAGALERFEREMRSAGKVNHPNIVTAFAALSLDGLIAFAMEYVDGTDLSKLVQAHGRLPVSNACYYINQAAKALQYAHEKGMVHRDIKPGNLMLTRDGKRQVVKVLDFGLAKATSENQLDGGLTGTGQMLGTPQYIAPEQIENAAGAGIQADIYSLGCTLYYLLSGSPPFDGKTSLYAVLHAHQVEPARPLNEIRPDVPAEVVAIVDKMMAKSPAERYQEPGEVAHALAPYFKAGIKPIPASGVPFSQAAPSAIDSNVAPSPEDTKTDNLRSRDTIVPPAKSTSRPAVPPASSPVQTTVENVGVRDGDERATGSERNQAVAPERKMLFGRAWALVVVGLFLAGLAGIWATGIFKAREEKVDSGGSSIAKAAPALADESAPEAAAASDDEAAAMAGESSDGPEVDVPPTSVAHSIDPVPANELPDGMPQPQLPKGFERLVAPFTAKQANAVQKAWATALGTKVVERNSIGMDLVLIPPGKFLMGRNAAGRGGYTGSVPINPGMMGTESQVDMTIANAFYLGKTEVTQGQWQAVMGTTPWQGKRGVRDGVNFPAMFISWEDAKAFCQKLGEISNRPYRLPTEAEWEFACRAGTTTRFSFGDDESQAAEYALYNKQGLFSNSRGSEASADEVGQRKPNAFGLYDMHGNVWEMCEDLFAAKMRGGSDPFGSSPLNLYRVMRGGCWSVPAAACDSANRNRVASRSGGSREGNGEVGFRIALPAVTETGKIDTGPQTASQTVGALSADSGDAASGSVKDKDPLQAGSVWKGKTVLIAKKMRNAKSEVQMVTLTVLERSGESFKATLDVNNSGAVREIQGTVNGNKLSWLAKDVTLVKSKSSFNFNRMSKTNQAFDSTGTIKGTKIEITYAYLESDGQTRVTATMNLKKE